MLVIKGIERGSVEHKLGSLLPQCKLLGRAAKSLKMLSWPRGSYSGIPEMQSGPCSLSQVLNVCAKGSNFAAVTKPALLLFKEKLDEWWDLLLEE